MGMRTECSGLQRGLIEHSGYDCNRLGSSAILNTLQTRRKII
jgi:hypothetical protein